MRRCKVVSTAGAASWNRAILRADEGRGNDRLVEAVRTSQRLVRGGQVETGDKDTVMFSKISKDVSLWMS